MACFALCAQDSLFLFVVIAEGACHIGMELKEYHPNMEMHIKSSFDIDKCKQMMALPVGGARGIGNDAVRLFLEPLVVATNHDVQSSFFLDGRRHDDLFDTAVVKIGQQRLDLCLSDTSDAADEDDR